MEILRESTLQNKKVNNEAVLFFIFFSNLLKAQKSKPNISDSVIQEYKYHLAKLDSVFEARKGDTILYCSPYSISFVEANSGIISRSDHTAFGKIKFFKSDLILWRKWIEDVCKQR
ncbi:hypothetical protein DC498_15865 [Terrimonas sp.]|nr:hypothetical protein DC498_15865 [Terrimonas sp.]